MVDENNDDDQADGTGHNSDDSVGASAVDDSNQSNPEGDANSKKDQEEQHEGTPNILHQFETSEEGSYNTHMYNTYLLSTYNDPESYQIITTFQLMAAQCLKARVSMLNKDEVDSFIKNLETQVKEQIETWTRNQEPSIGNLPHAQRPNKCRSYADAPRQVHDLFTQGIISILEHQQRKTKHTTSATTELVSETEAGAEAEAEAEAEESETET